MSNRNFQRQHVMPNLMSSNGTGSGFTNRPAARPTPSPSPSLPNLAASLFKKSFIFGTASTMTMTPPIFGIQNPTRLVPPGVSKSTSSMCIPKVNHVRSRLSIPTFGSNATEMLQKNDPKIPNPHDMILGALRAGDIHFPRGMKSSDILEVVYSVYTNIPKTQAAETSLKRTLENLVAKGVVSRSFGSKASDATFRVVNVNTGSHSMSGLDGGFGLNLTVSGTGIKPTASGKHFTSGHCLPSGKNFQTRVARHTFVPKQPPPIHILPKRTSISSCIRKPTNPITSFTFSEKRKLSKSLASRVGAIDTLKPLQFIPNTPVTSSRGHGDCGDSYTKHSRPQDSSDLDSDDDQASEDEIALSQRFRDYAHAVLLDEVGDEAQLEPIGLTNELTADVEIEKQHYSENHILQSESALQTPLTRGGDHRGDFLTSIMTTETTTSKNHKSDYYASKKQIEGLHFKQLNDSGTESDEADPQPPLGVSSFLSSILEDRTDDDESEVEEVAELESSEDEDDSDEDS